MENSIINEVLMHVDDNNRSRVFLPSTSINIFPCSRRGQATIGAKAEFYDPEARLNTERTNRIGSAINGFTESFIINEDFDANDTANNTLKFVLAGYRVEIKNFKPSDIANALGSTNKLYAHLSIHDKVLVNSVTLDVDNIEDYYTEILYRQPISSNEADALSLDVTYGTTTPISFFVGVSFTAENSIIDTIPAANSFRQLPSRDLLLFTKSDEDEWVLEQTSLLPKIDHDTAENSVVVGELHVKQNLQVDSTITIGDPDIGEVDRAAGDLAAKRILVPYDGSIENFPNTEIKDTGISTAYIRAGSIKADGLAVGNTITIVDDQDRDGDSDIDEALTTIGKGYVSAVDKLTVPEVFTAEAGLANKVTIDAANGLEVTEHTKVKTLEVTETANVYQTLNVQKAQGATDPAIANIDNAVIGSLIIGEKADGDTFTNGTIKVKQSIKTPTLDVKTIKNDDTEAVTVDDDLAVTGKLELAADKAVSADTVNVNTINSRADSAIEITSPVEVSNVLEVIGETTLQSNLKVADNINVGTPTTPATAENGGYIVAKKDITAEQDLIAKNDATVGHNLTVTNHTNTKTLEATESIKTPALDVIGIENTVDATGVNINDDLNVITGHAVTVDTVKVDTIKSRAADGTITINDNTALAKNLTVGTDDDADTGTITATNLVKTPTLNVNSITSDGNGIEINKSITVTNGDTVLKDLTAEDTKVNRLMIGDGEESDALLTVYGKTLLTDDFIVQHEVGGNIQTSFKVTKDATILGPTGMSSLIVGEITEEDTFEDNTVKVKGQIETPTLKATTVVTTPELNVTVEGSSTAQANIDNATVTGTFKVQKGEDDTVLVKDGAVTVTGSTTLTGTLTVTDTTTLENGLEVSKGDLTVNENAEVIGALSSGSLSTGAAGTTSLGVTGHSTLATASVEQLDSGITVTEGLALGTVTNIVGQVPALKLATQENGSVRLCFNFGTTIEPAE